MNLKPLLMSALIATGSITGYAQKAAPTPAVSEVKTVAASLDKQIGAFESATDAATATQLFTQIKETLKNTLHAAKKDMAAKEPLTEDARNIEMAHFTKLETAYFDIRKNANLATEDRPAMAVKLKAFAALLK